MAGDIRDPPSTPPQAKTYETFTPENANVLPAGSGQNTAGSKKEMPSLTQAIKTVRIEDFKQVHMYPCVRESLMMGIGGAFGVGGLRALLGGVFSSFSLVLPFLFLFRMDWDWIGVGKGGKLMVS
jgi:cytochrome c oxidase assembly protein subunit 20